MSQASTQVEVMRRKMIRAVDQLSTEDIRAMLLASIRTANDQEMLALAAASSFADFDTMESQLDLTV